MADGVTRKLARSDVLRRSELALMRDLESPYYAHPIFWAPFTVIGEGGAIGGPVK